MKTVRTIFAVILAAMLLMVGAQAQTVRFVGEECPIPVASEPGGIPETVPCSEISFLGKCEDGSLLVLCNNQAGYAALADVVNLLDNEISLDDLPEAPFLETVYWDDDQDKVIFVQQLLCDAGYLHGKADGLFGYGTIDALSAFQSQAGLPESRTTVDPLTQAMLLKAIQGDSVQEIPYPLARTAEEKFAAIAGRTDWDLEKLMDAKWRLLYDGFEGTGIIEADLMVGGYLNDGAALNRIAATADLILVVSDGTTDQVRLSPAIRVVAEGASGVYSQSLSLKSGSTVLKLENPAVSREILGTLVHEEAVFELTGEAMELLRASCEDGLSIRLTGSNNTYDFFSDGVEDTVAAFLDVCE